MEEAIKGIHEALKQLTGLMIAKAESDTKLTGVIKTTDDYEIRIRSLEAKSSASQWVVLSGAVVGKRLAYQDALDAAQTVEEVNAIKPVFP